MSSSTSTQSAGMLDRGGGRCTGGGVTKRAGDVRFAFSEFGEAEFGEGDVGTGGGGYLGMRKLLRRWRRGKEGSSWALGDEREAWEVGDMEHIESGRDL